MIINDYLSELERELGIQVSPHLPIYVRQDNVRDAVRNLKASQQTGQSDGYTACLECGLMIPIGQVLCPSHLN